MFREMGRGGEREGQKHPCVVASCTFPTGDPAHNPGMCPDWELNRLPLVRRLALNLLSHTNQWHHLKYFKNSTRFPCKLLNPVLRTQEKARKPWLPVLIVMSYLPAPPARHQSPG